MLIHRLRNENGCTWSLLQKVPNHQVCFHHFAHCNSNKVIRQSVLITSHVESTTFANNFVGLFLRSRAWVFRDSGIALCLFFYKLLVTMPKRHYLKDSHPCWRLLCNSVSSITLETYSTKSLASVLPFGEKALEGLAVLNAAKRRPASRWKTKSLVHGWNIHRFTV